MAWIYIFKYPQPGQEDGIINPIKGSAPEEDMAIAMSRFSYIIFDKKNSVKIFVKVPAVAPAPALSLWTPVVIQNSEHFCHKLSVRVMTVASSLAICVAPKA